MYKTDKVNPYLVAIIFSFLIGFSFLGIKMSQPYANQLEILTHRYNFAFIAAAFVYLIKKKEIKTEDNKNKKILFLTAICYILFMVLQVSGVFYTTSILGAIIFSITPIIVQILASIFLNEKSNAKQNIFVVVTVASLIYMIVAGQNNMDFNLFGCALLIIASLSMAFSNIGMRYIRSEYTPIEITFHITTLGFVLFNGITIVSGIKNGTLDTYFEPLKNYKFMLSSIYLGVGCLFITSQLMAFMLSKLEAIKATIFGNLSTAISIIAGVVLLDENLYSYHVVCAIIIVIGVIGVNVYGNK